MYISIKRHSWFFKSWWCLLYFGHVQMRTIGKCWRQKTPFCLKLSTHAQWRQKTPFCLKLSTHAQKSVLSWSISMSRILGKTWIPPKFSPWRYKFWIVYCNSALVVHVYGFATIYDQKDENLKFSPDRPCRICECPFNWFLFYLSYSWS